MDNISAIIDEKGSIIWGDINLHWFLLILHMQILYTYII